MIVLCIAFAALFSFALYEQIAEYREVVRQHTAMLEELARRARRPE